MSSVIELTENDILEDLAAHGHESIGHRERVQGEPPLLFGRQNWRSSLSTIEQDWGDDSLDIGGTYDHAKKLVGLT